MTTAPETAKSADGMRSKHAEQALSVTGPPSDLPFRATLEDLFGTPLGSVRAYLNQGSALARYDAHAAAWSESVAFAAEPTLPLVAHEVAHVVQLRSTPPSRAFSRIGDASEREADAIAHAVARGAHRVSVQAPRTAALSFSPDPGPVQLISQHTTQGIADAREGRALEWFENRVLHSHWPSTAARRAYTRAFLIEHHRITTGTRIDPDELNLWLVRYEHRLAEGARQSDERAAATGRARGKALRDRLIQEVMQELTKQRAQRLMGTDPRKYPVLIEHAAIGAAFGDKLELLLKCIPLLGELMAVIEGVVGQELITGQKLGAGERTLSIVLSILPVAGQILAAGKAGVRMIATIVTRSRLSARQIVQLLEGMAELDPQTVLLARTAFEGGKLTAKETKALRTILRLLDEDGSFAARGRTALGAAQTPKLQPWRINPDGPRTVEQAVEIARARGVIIPDDIKFGVVRGKWPEGRFAEYAQLGMKADPDALVSWTEFYNRFDKIPVRLNPQILASDEAIVAVIGHEMHELNGLRALFDMRGGAMPAGELARLIKTEVKGNLHDEAWDIADELVKFMREGQ